MFGFRRSKKRGVSKQAASAKALLGRAVEGAGDFHVETLGPLEVAVLSNLGRPSPAPPPAPKPAPAPQKASAG